MPTDCETIRDISADLKRRQRLKPDFKEESLTDIFLSEISARISSIHYHDFTRHEESKTTGADWDWWFLFSGGTFRLRVQAKRLKSPSENYAGINHKKGDQLRKLRDSSKHVNAMPFYVFYSSLEEKTNCRQGVSGDGAFIVDAETVSELMKAQEAQTIPSGELLRVALPISCVVCCPLISGSQYPTGAFFSHYFPSAIRERPDSDLPAGYFPDAPEHISAFAELDPDELDEWATEHREFFGDASRVVTYDLRTNA